MGKQAGRSSLFQNTGSLRPGRSVFDLSYDKKLTCDMGQLIPIMCDEVVPGDVFNIGNQAVIRFQPMVAPILHEVNYYVHYFFVPYRLLWDEWEDFITGGVSGDLTPSIPTWDPTNFALNSLWDYLGFPIGLASIEAPYPIQFPQTAYNFIYNEYYRDENLMAEVALDNESILNRCWEKDYFTSSLPWQQRGTAVGMPVSVTGTTSAIWTDANGFIVANPNPVLGVEYGNSGSGNENKAGTVSSVWESFKGFMNSNTVNMSSAVATTFDVTDLRLAFQIQKWMERNARAGARYTEFLGAHFGVSPRDDRLQRPEYIGGMKAPVVVSEVLQTSETDTSPQGNLAGHGLGVANGFCGKYRAQEFGLIMGLMSVMPKPAYSQGINRQWLRQTKYDFYFPEFANLSEQAIINSEICHTVTPAQNNGIFGYQGRYDEMRIKPSMYCGEMRTTFDYWHLGRQFDPDVPPILNQEFLTCIPRKDIFAVPSVPCLIVNISNYIKAVRPLPVTAEPGLIDHN